MQFHYDAVLIVFMLMRYHSILLHRYSINAGLFLCCAVSSCSAKLMRFIAVQFISKPLRYGSYQRYAVTIHRSALTCTASLIRHRSDQLISSQILSISVLYISVAQYCQSKTYPSRRKTMHFVSSTSINLAIPNVSKTKLYESFPTLSRAHRIPCASSLFHCSVYRRASFPLHGNQGLSIPYFSITIRDFASPFHHFIRKRAVSGITPLAKSVQFAEVQPLFNEVRANRLFIMSQSNDIEFDKCPRLDLF